MIINPYDMQDDSKNINENVEEELNQNILDKNKIIDEISGEIVSSEKEYVISGQREIIKEKIKQILHTRYNVELQQDKKEILSAILDKIFGYGILQKYIVDNLVSDIRVVEYDKVYIKSQGIWQQVDESFENKEKLEDYIRFCALKNNAVINYETPVVVFSDRINGLRIEAGIEPANIVSPSIVIRIHRKDGLLTLDNLLKEYKMINKSQYVILKKAIYNQNSMVICGKGGSGKTTLMRALLTLIPKEVAITTNEETAELYLDGRNCIQRECINNRQDNKNIDLEKLAKQALVMSNDVIIIGELKGAEASTFFDSIATGHMGLATVHADCAANTIDRLITLIKKDIKATQYTEGFLRRFLVSSLDYIIYMRNFKVDEIVTIEYNEKTNVVVTKVAC